MLSNLDIQHRSYIWLTVHLDITAFRPHCWLFSPRSQSEMSDNAVKHAATCSFLKPSLFPFRHKVKTLEMCSRFHKPWEVPSLHFSLQQSKRPALYPGHGHWPAGCHQENLLLTAADAQRTRCDARLLGCQTQRDASRTRGNHSREQLYRCCKEMSHSSHQLDGSQPNSQLLKEEVWVHGEEVLWFLGQEGLQYVKLSNECRTKQGHSLELAFVASTESLCLHINL